MENKVKPEIVSKNSVNLFSVKGNAFFILVLESNKYLTAHLLVFKNNEMISKTRSFYLKIKIIKKQSE